MAFIERDIMIAASSEDIFYYAADPNSLPDWYVGIAAVQPDGVWPEEGGQIGVTYKVSGITLDVTATVLTYNAPHEFVFQMDGMVNGTFTWSYSDEGDFTNVYVAADYTLPGGALGAAVDKMVVEDMNIRNGEQSLANLKAIFEG